MRPSPKPTWEQFKALPEPEQKAVFEQLIGLIDIVASLRIEVDELKAKLAKNSRNSSKPPSSDGPAKRTMSSRESTGRKPGGQPGRSGATLMQVENPDEVILHAAPGQCLGCAAVLGEASHVERRQVFDLPQIIARVVEHRCEVKCCQACGQRSSGAFPDGVVAPAQYGENVKTLSAYLHAHQLLPFDRVAQLFADVFSLPLSPATVEKSVRAAASNVESQCEAIKAALIRERVAHFDETGLRCGGKRIWLHSASSDRYAYYAAHANRGLKATDEIGIFARFRGVAVHDAWAPYWSNEKCLHALCNAHHLRELRFLFEHAKEAWAGIMKALLSEMRDAVAAFRIEGCSRLPKFLIRDFESRYDLALEAGFAHHDALRPLTGSKQRPGKNLIDRLELRKQEALRFMHRFSVPFTNNLAERDLRMQKVKEKISGCFRTVAGATAFFLLRTYVVTARKQGGNAYAAILAAVRGQALALAPRT